MKNLRIFIWGCGTAYEGILEDKYIIKYIDTNPEKQGKIYNGKYVIAPEEVMLYEEDFDYILIGVPHRETEIIEQAQKLGISKERILSSKLYYEPVEVWFNESYKSLIENEYITVIKEWYYAEEYKTTIFTVEKRLGRCLKLLIMPYGGLCKDFGKRSILIEEISNNKMLYHGTIVGFEEILIPIDSEKMIIKFRISGMGAAYLKADFIDDKLSSIVNKIQNLETRNAYYRELDYQFSMKFHERDYSVLKHIPNDNYVILDIGANLGQSAMSFLSETNMDVISFEPHPNYIEPLNVTKELFDHGERMQIVNKGVGNYSGELVFYIPRFEEDITQEASFSKEHVIKRIKCCFPDREPKDTDIEEMKVPIVKIDDVITKSKKPVFFVKVDAETFEYEVIQGMKNVIKKDAPLLLLERNSKEKQDEIYQFVNELHKYKIMYWDWQMDKFTDVDIRGSINYFLVPQEGAIYEEIKKVFECL